MTFRVHGTVWLVALTALSACGSSDTTFSGGGDGSAGASADGSAGSGSGGSSGNAGAAGSGASSGAGGQECNGTHPLVDGGVRFCDVGQCRCETSDLCFPQDQAARCCEGKIRCFTGDGPVECTGSHPIVDGSARFCEQGACYCEAEDTCFPAEIATLCCGQTPKCG